MAAFQSFRNLLSVVLCTSVHFAIQRGNGLIPHRYHILLDAVFDLRRRKAWAKNKLPQVPFRASKNEASTTFYKIIEPRRVPPTEILSSNACIGIRLKALRKSIFFCYLAQGTDIHQQRIRAIMLTKIERVHNT